MRYGVEGLVIEPKIYRGLSSYGNDGYVGTMKMERNVHNDVTAYGDTMW